MKKNLKVGLATLAAGVLGCGVLCEQAQAIPINGSIQFGGSATASGPSPGSPVNIIFANPWQVTGRLGDYSPVTVGTSATFNNFSFTGDGVGALLSAGVTPLWSFSFGGLNYSFDLASLSSGHTEAGSMAFSGNGTAHIDGFDPTPAAWSMEGAGNNFNFEISFSTTTPVGAVPEGGTTMALFGIGLAAILFLRRQLRLP